MAARQAPIMASPTPTVRFSDRVDAYVRARPGYPDAAIEHLLEATGTPPGGTVADLGAGTGLLARPLVDRGFDVRLVEPNGPMADAAEALLGERARIVRAPAEATTLEPGSIDLAVAGQAFHWFDPIGTRRELLRILRPPGRLALLWHRRRTAGTPFLEAYEAFLCEWGVDYDAVKETYERPADLRGVFGGLVPAPARFEYAQRLDRRGLLERLLSCSYMPGADHPRHPSMRAAVDDLFDAYAEAGEVVLSYDTVVYAGTTSRAPSRQGAQT